MLDFHLHGICHEELYHSKDVQAEVSRLCGKIQEGIQKLMQSVASIQERFDLALLQTITHTMGTFRESHAMIMEDLNKVKISKAKREYETLAQKMRDVKSSIGTAGKNDAVSKLLSLSRQQVTYRLRLETMLELTCRMTSILRNRGKKVLDDDLSVEDQQIILKAVAEITKPDYVQNYLPRV
eukprot:CAMPEP_0115031480 /NCGR_PEP_ID=MMETSP0216-20121206/38564_1 /TAXON_ID=223996 /ORGANISM="Protocruzia adherens, Strain Boccale" /LENGTH=181 /DNA_ID=CAMNT_0002409149 /DNA_START=65 /DNA_END=610 /DNA_ORIENTATION=-